MAAQVPPCCDVIAAAFIEYRSALSRLVGSIVGPHSIEDIVQDTFIRSYEASRKQTINHPRSFMWMTARNLALNHVQNSNNKRKVSAAEFFDADIYGPADSCELEAEFEWNERFLVFRAALESLPLQCRRAFVLKKVYGLSQRETADHLEISESTVEKQVAKGLLMCARFMDAKGYPVNGARQRRQ